VLTGGDRESSAPWRACGPLNTTYAPFGGGAFPREAHETFYVGGGPGAPRYMGTDIARNTPT